MQLVIYSDDFRKLSSNCQRELIALLARDAKPASIEGGPFDLSDPEDGVPGSYLRPPQRPTTEDVPEEKQKLVVDINVEEARDLVANISEKSVQTLKRFALGEPIALTELVGPTRPYRDQVDLKRSFVGAVNRRLRTVREKIKKSRMAFLFAGVRGDEARIKITSKSAAALRRVLEIREPLPASMFYEPTGKPLPLERGAAKKLHEKLELAWQEYSGQLRDDQDSVERTDALKHFLAHGFQAWLGAFVEIAPENEDEPPSVSFVLSEEDVSQWLSRMDPIGEIYLRPEESGWPADIFLTHSEVPGVLAELGGSRRY